MERLTYIYKITSPSNKIYIGSTFNVNNRKSHYKNLHCIFQFKLYNSLKKYGWDNHVFEVIETCTQSNRNEREVYWGSYFNVLSQEGLNCKLPKALENYSCVSEETRKKMSTWQIGRKMSEASKKKMSDIKKKNPPSKDNLKKAQEVNKKQILQYSKETGFIKEWESAAEVQRVLKINSGHIRSCCLGKRKTAGKFIWIEKTKKNEKN